MDWKLLVDGIKSTGMTQEQIAESIGCSVGSLSELINGKVNEPKWSRGDALISLHRRRNAKRKAA